MPITSHAKEITHCIIIATYNNDKTLGNVIEQTLEVCTDVIVVNDGSTDNTLPILQSYPCIKLITYEQNVGKGHALALGFKKAQELGFDYAITIDSDGQHYPDDIPALVDKLMSAPGKVIMGSRNMAQADVPGKSSFGNKFSSFWFWAETGIKLSDTQTGFRAYPLEPLKKKRFFTKKFEFEIEIIVRLAWQNVTFTEVPVKVNYPKNRVSHFRPFKDFGRISVLNTVLVILAYSFYLPRLLILNFSLKTFWGKLKTEFLKDLSHPVKISFAVGLGLFFGVFPIWGFQMMAAFAVATYFKLNRALVLLVSNISIPPMIPIIIYSSFQLGGLFVNDKIYIVNSEGISTSSIQLHFFQYVCGAIALSLGLFVIGFVTTWVLAVFFNRNK